MEKRQTGRTAVRSFFNYNESNTQYQKTTQCSSLLQILQIQTVTGAKERERARALKSVPSILPLSPYLSLCLLPALSWAAFCLLLFYTCQTNFTFCYLLHLGAFVSHAALYPRPPCAPTPLVLYVECRQRLIEIHKIFAQRNGLPLLLLLGASTDCRHCIMCQARLNLNSNICHIEEGKQISRNMVNSNKQQWQK